MGTNYVGTVYNILYILCIVAFGSFNQQERKCTLTQVWNSETHNAWDIMAKCGHG